MEKMNKQGQKKSKKVEAEAWREKLVALEHQLFDLSSLMQAGKAFDNLLGVRELYSVFTSIVQERFGVDTYALFIMNAAQNQFQLVRGFGLPEDFPLEYSFPREEGLLWQAIFQGRPFATVDSLGHARFAVPFNKFGLDALDSHIFVPLVHQARVVGALSVGKKGSETPYTDEELQFLTNLAEQAAVSITTARLYEKNEQDRAELDKTVKNLSILYNIGRMLIHIGDLKTLLKFILGQAIDTTEAQKGSLMLYDQNTKRLVVQVVKGLPDKKTEEAINEGTLVCTSFAVGEGIAGKVFETKEPMIVNATDEDDQYKASNDSNVDSILCIPLVASDDAIGVINITNKVGGKGFSYEDLELLTALGNQAAVAINNATLYEMAITDELTKLYIRRFFDVKLGSEINRADRYHHSLSLAICDLDLFKRVNDNYGHQVGDKVLQKVASLIKASMREMDTAARYGGEEFAIILPETDAEGALAMAERVRVAVADAKVEGFPEQMTISIGVAVYPEHTDNAKDLIRLADTALYAAKDEGRNRACLYVDEAKKKKK